MEQIWAPWRLEYYRDKGRVDECVFCIGEDPADDRRRYVLKRGHKAFAMLNKYPFAGGHLMVIPYRHVGDISDLSDEEALEIHRLTAHCCNAMRRIIGAEGFNIGINLGIDGGAGIQAHFHQHVVPRWRGDTNFMPLLAEVRVLPQHLDETYDLLAPILAEKTL